jgi:SnoaL-like domain
VTVGNVGFDAADRLAIINLLGAYAHTYDEDRLDEFRALFTESPELVLWHGGPEMSSDIETVMPLLGLRKAAFKAENNQRRHALNSIWFTSQTGGEASGRCYFQVFAIRDGGAPSPEITGCYEFTAVKQDGAWRFGRWVLKADQTGPGV